MQIKGKRKKAFYSINHVNHLTTYKINLNISSYLPTLIIHLRMMAIYQLHLINSMFQDQPNEPKI